MCEETGSQTTLDQLNYFKKVFVRFLEYDIAYHIFQTRLDHSPLIIISEEEHRNFRWISPRGALDPPLIGDGDTCIRLFYKI